MIVVGTATVNPSTGKVELVAPLGFGTARGIRLSNFTGDSLILTNISGVDQSQEYLAPQTQMVYPTDNIGATPTIVGYSYGSEQIAQNLLVEWSTEPNADFIGTYPAALPAAISATGIGSSIFDSGTITDFTFAYFAGPFEIADDYAVIQMQLEQAMSPTQSVCIAAFEQATSPDDANLYYTPTLACAVITPEAGQIGSLSLPVALTHIGPLYIVIRPSQGAGTTGSLRMQVYGSNNPAYDRVPTSYLDIYGTLYYSTTFTPTITNDPVTQDLTLMTDQNVADDNWATVLQYIRTVPTEFRLSAIEYTSGNGLHTYGALTVPNGLSLLYPYAGALIAFTSATPVITSSATAVSHDSLISESTNIIFYNNDFSGAGNGAPFTLIITETTDTGPITVWCTLTQARETYSTYNILINGGE